MNRLAPALGLLAIALGLALVLGTAAPSPQPLSVTAPPLPTRAVAAAATSPLATLSPAITVAPTSTVAPPIPAGYRIQIPRLGIDLPIAEGELERDTVRQDTPEGWAFHLPGTALPGGGSNSYMYAHARRGMFLALWNARVGDEVHITTPDKRVLRYVVDEVHRRIEPSDVSWAAPTSSERLTLQTSTGANPADPRFVVIALPA